MLFQRNRKTKTKSNTLPQKTANDILSLEDKLRRELYERIAQGNALAEIEESIHRKWSH